MIAEGKIAMSNKAAALAALLATSVFPAGSGTDRQG